MRYAFLLVCLITHSALAQTEVSVFDGRDLPLPEDQTRWAAEPAVTEARTAARSHFGRLYSRADWSFSVLSVSRGSFTVPDALQFAVLYTLGSAGRCCPLNGLAVVEEGRLVRNIVDVAGGHYLRPLPDINGNGLDELVSFGGFMGQGVYESSVNVLEFEDTGIRNWGYTWAHIDACGSLQPGSDARAWVITATSGSSPQFYTQEYRKGGCSRAGNAQGAWRARGRKIRVTLEDRGGNAPVELFNTDTSRRSGAVRPPSGDLLVVEEAACHGEEESDENVSCSFENRGDLCEIAPQGLMTCSRAGRLTSRVQLSMEDGYLGGLSFIRLSDGVVVIYPSSDAESVVTLAAKIPDGSEGPLWTVPVGAFNMADPVISGSSVYFASIRSLSRLELDRGAIAWDQETPFNDPQTVRLTDHPGTNYDVVEVSGVNRHDGRPARFCYTMASGEMVGCP